MDHETEVAAPKAPTDPEVDKRVAAFKRGAPLPKPSRCNLVRILDCLEL